MSKEKKHQSCCHISEHSGGRGHVEAGGGQWPPFFPRLFSACEVSEIACPSGLPLSPTTSIGNPRGMTTLGGGNLGECGLDPSPLGPGSCHHGHSWPIIQPDPSPRVLVEDGVVEEHPVYLLEDLRGRTEEDRK